jgi:hypothetical protein
MLVLWLARFQELEAADLCGFLCPLKNEWM